MWLIHNFEYLEGLQDLMHLYILKRQLSASCNRIVVSTSRCGRDNPGSNPGYSILLFSKSFYFRKTVGGFVDFSRKSVHKSEDALYIV